MTSALRVHPYVDAVIGHRAYLDWMVKAHARESHLTAEITLDRAYLASLRPSVPAVTAPRIYLDERAAARAHEYRFVARFVDARVGLAGLELEVGHLQMLITEPELQLTSH